MNRYYYTKTIVLKQMKLNKIKSVAKIYYLIIIVTNIEMIQFLISQRNY